jgi:hypothetical protein
MRDIGLSLAIFGMILTATGVDRLMLRGPDGALLCSTYLIPRDQPSKNLPSNNLPGNNLPGDDQPGQLCPHGVLCQFRRTMPDA